MSAIGRRFGTAIERLGDLFDLKGTAYRGVFSVISATRAGILLTEAQMLGAGRPFRMVYVSPSVPAAAGDSVDWNGGTYTIKKVVPMRLRDETLANALIIV
jgi:hypothetical protein